MAVRGEPLTVGEFELGEREQIVFSISYDDATTVAHSSTYVWQGTSDVTSTIMPSGNFTVSNNVLTLKPVQAFTGGKSYVVDVLVTADGQYVERFIKLNIARKERGFVRLK